MSLSFYLYRAPEDAGPLTTWQGNLAQPQGTIEEVKTRISALYPDLKWTQGTVTNSTYWSGLGRNRIHAPYLDLSVSTATMDRDNTSGQVYFVVGRKMPPSIMRTLMEALDLNHVCCVDAGVLVDPYAYTDEDPYYAEKAWPRP